MAPDFCVDLPASAFPFCACTCSCDARNNRDLFFTSPVLADTNGRITSREKIRRVSFSCIHSALVSSFSVDQALLLPSLLRDFQERVPVDGHAVQPGVSGLSVPALRLHPAEGGLLQLVPGHDLARQNHHQRHRPLNPP